jgi:protocatechuate 3,4-dioxygenase beta subunit
MTLMRSIPPPVAAALASCLGLVLLAGWAAGASAQCAQEEWDEAYQQTKDEWEAVVKTMKETKTKLEEYRKTYQEWEDFFYDQTKRRDAAAIAQVLGISEEKATKEAWDQVQGYFNNLNTAGVQGKLDTTIETLGKGMAVADGVTNAWDFAEKFNPQKAKDNPTYGLRLIGDLLSDKLSDIKRIPVVGPSLVVWVNVYIDATKDYADALDRLSRKIQENARQGALCGQSGIWLEQQAEFRKVATGLYSGEDCLSYFLAAAFPRLRSQVFIGQNHYFIYHTPMCRGYFGVKGNTEKVYAWHGLLLAPRALHPDWLCSRSNSLTPSIESDARRTFGRMNAVFKKTDPSWIIAARIGTYGVAETYGSLEEEVFVANFVLDERIQTAVEDFLRGLDRYVLAGGTVADRGTQKPLAGASVRLTVGDNTKSTSTGASGDWEILMEGRPGDPASLDVAKGGYTPHAEAGGRMPQRVVTAWNVTLAPETTPFIIEGRVLNKATSPASPIAGAAVTASVAGDGAGGSPATGSATSAGDGSYRLVLEVPGAADGAVAAVAGTASGASASVDVVLQGSGKSGVDIVLDLPEETAGGAWTIDGTVVDRHGEGIPGAGINGGPAPATSGPAGAFSLPPVDVSADVAAGRTPSFTLSAAVTAEGGTGVAGPSVTVAYEGEPASHVTLTIGVDMPVEVTISGRVQDAKGVAIDGVAVSSDKGASAVSGPGGSFTLGPLYMTRDESVLLTPSLTDKATGRAFGGAAVAVVYQGMKAIPGVLLVLDAQQEAELTLQGRVTDRSGITIPDATVAAKGVEVAAAGGAFTIPGVLHVLGDPLTLQATVVTAGGTAVTGAATITPTQASTSGIEIRIDVDMQVEVTVSGTVRDMNGLGVGGVTVATDRGPSGASDASGAFTVGPMTMTRDETVTLTPTLVDDAAGRTYGGASVTVAFAGRTPVTGVQLSIDAVQDAEITIDGRVVDRNGVPVPEATVSAKGASATATGGSFSLSGIRHVLGDPLAVQASVVTSDGSTVTGSAQVTPRSAVTGGVVISVDVEVRDAPEDTTSEDSEDVPPEEEDGDEDGEGDDLDEAIDEVAGDGEDLDQLLAAFEAAVSEERRATESFELYAGSFEQRLRELASDPCGDRDVAYSLVQARDALFDHGLAVVDLSDAYAALKGALFTAGLRRPDVDDAFRAATGRGGSLRARYGDMVSRLRDDYGCDADVAERIGEEVSEGGADPDDIDSGVKGTDPDLIEICGDGVDNDGDNQIDECDAGCCEGRAVIVVSDCGSAADDVFLVRLDTGASGVTPTGASTTFSDDLSPGTHSVTLQVLSAPDNVGTYCLSISVDGVEVLYREGSPPEGTSETWTFFVPEPGEGFYMRVSPQIHRDPSGLSQENAGP